MSVTITRTAWIDDDGTGTTGTVINNAVKTDLYNQIDGALAKVAQLTGGNSFTGNQNVAGILNVTAGGQHTVVASVAGMNSVMIVNLLPSGSGAQLIVGNDADPNMTVLQTLSSTFGPTGAFYPNSSSLTAGGANGLSVACTHATGAIRLYTNGLERARVAPTGELLINATTNSAAGMLALQADSAAGQRGLVITSRSVANNLTYMQFNNTVDGSAGNVVQTGATTVAYNTASDGRLKTDHGRAADLSGLRAVTVHDFTWTADGVADRGIFAQEAHALYPRAIVPGTDERTDSGALAHPWMTDYSKFVPDLIVGWQQHDAALAELRAALATLKGSPDAQ